MTLEDAIRAGWCRWTSDPVDQPGWTEANHDWNRLSDGRELDLTREPFRRGEIVGDPAGAAVSVKGVCRDARGRVLVCRNHRGEWELPGGRPDAGELFHDCVKRELREETALDVAVERVLGVRLLEVGPGAWVDLVAYECTLTGPVAPRASGEHSELAFSAPEALVGLPAAYAELIDACSSRPRS